jgi:hypothetical protein
MWEYFEDLYGIKFSVKEVGYGKHEPQDGAGQQLLLSQPRSPPIMRQVACYWGGSSWDAVSRVQECPRQAEEGEELHVPRPIGQGHRHETLQPSGSHTYLRRVSFCAASYGKLPLGESGF